MEPVYASEGGASTKTREKSVEASTDRDISERSTSSDRLVQIVKESSGSHGAEKTLNLFKTQPSEVSVHAVQTAQQVSTIDATEVLQFLAPHLNENVSRLMEEERKLSVHEALCGSKGRIEDVLARIKASRMVTEVSPSLQLLYLIIVYY